MKCADNIVSLQIFQSALGYDNFKKIKLSGRNLKCLVKLRERRLRVDLRNRPVFKGGEAVENAYGVDMTMKKCYEDYYNECVDNDDDIEIQHYTITVSLIRIFMHTFINAHNDFYIFFLSASELHLDGRWPANVETNGIQFFYEIVGKCCADNQGNAECRHLDTSFPRLLCQFLGRWQEQGQNNGYAELYIMKGKITHCPLSIEICCHYLLLSI